MLILLCVFTFVKLKTTADPKQPNKTTKLVVIGLYKYSRNPMYLGLIIILTGIALYCGAISSFIVVLAFMIFITQYQIVPEELVLQQKFKKEYTEYLKNVRRWL